MTHARGQHPNAPLTPEGRRRMVTWVLDRHWSVEVTAERFQVDATTVRKWRDREGHVVGRCRVKRLMCSAGLHGVRRSKTLVTTNRTRARCVPRPDQRDFTAAHPNAP